MMWNGYHMNGWGYGFLGVGSLLLWIVLILGAVVLYRYVQSGSNSSASTPESTRAEELLAQRYARGEIDEQGYLHALDVLRRHQPHA